MQINSFPKKIKKSLTNNFKGHEAQPLRGVIVQNTAYFNGDYLFEELKAIADNYKLNLIKSNIDDVWTQDIITITPKGRVICNTQGLKNYVTSWLNLKNDKENIPHEQGGNLFYVKNKKGEQLLLTGVSRRNEFNKAIGKSSKYHAKRIVEIPKADFHLDLFITPIGNNKILLANDTLMLEKMNEMEEKINSLLKSKSLNIDLTNKIENVKKKLEKEIKHFKEEIKNNNFAHPDEVRTVLEEEGFEIINVPSRIYTSDIDELTHKLNYSNALTFKDKNNEVVFITGKSHLNDKIGITDEVKNLIGMDFESIFVEAVTPHIKKENIYFIKGSDDRDNDIDRILWNYGGGLHCMCCEIPTTI